MAFTPDGRLFVTEQAGTMQVANTDGTLQKTPEGTKVPFFNISSKVSAAGGHGLLSFAFDPAFDPTFATTNNYVYYTTLDTSVHNRVPRCPLLRTATAKSWLISTTRRLLSICPLSSAQNHNGGVIHFGTDGKLYVAVGENTRAWAAHSLNPTLGKMLRINKDGSIPRRHRWHRRQPLYAQTTGNNRAIWALGLRVLYLRPVCAAW